MSKLHDEIVRYMAEHRGERPADVARALGCAPSTVWRATHPEEHRERERARNAYKRQWDREQLVPCPNCGEGLVRLGRYERCRRCHEKEQRQERQRLEAVIHRLWHEGLATKDIAVAIGSTPQATAVRIVRMRESGWDMPYRHRRSNPKHPELVGS